MLKKIAFLFWVVNLCANASVIIEEEAYIFGHSPAVIKELIEAGSVEIDHVTSEGFEVYGFKGLLHYLDKKNLVYFNMKDAAKNLLVGYPSHQEIEQKLRAAQAKKPQIMKLFSIGRSVRGQELWAMKISDNVEVDEVEPEFKYIANMHGDEIAGRELTIFLIEEIAEKYGTDPEITELVDNTEIFIIPSMNPDGAQRPQRANGNGRDLNRNFPDIISDSRSNPSGREPETRAVMNFQELRQFSLSANFHGGTQVVNYPWDSKYDLHPLNDFVKELSQGYADLNPEMRDSHEFPGGITNGAAWYVVRRGMQDWSYFWHNDLQITVELTHRKYPPYSQMKEEYQNNRDALVYFMKQVHRGAGLKFSTKNIKGRVRIKQISPFSKDMGSFAFHSSEFYKVLPEGEYHFQVEVPGKESTLLEINVSKGLIAPNGNYVDL